MELERQHAWVLYVSTAFLHAPVIHPAVVSLPVGMEDENGEPLIVILEKAMNGLRSAGMSWYRQLLELEGLTACVTEKTIFAGRYKKGVAEPEEENHLIVLMYVDDLLVVGDDRNIQLLVDELSKKLRLKVTGKLEEDKIRFLGKDRERRRWNDCPVHGEGVLRKYDVLVSRRKGKSGNA